MIAIKQLIAGDVPPKTQNEKIHQKNVTFVRRFRITDYLMNTLKQYPSILIKISDIYYKIICI